MIYVFSSTILSPGLFINLFTCLLGNMSQLVSLSIYLVCLFVCQFVGQKVNLLIYGIISARFFFYQPLFFSSFLSVCPRGSQFVWQFVCLFGIITVRYFFLYFLTVFPFVCQFVCLFGNEHEIRCILYFFSRICKFFAVCLRRIPEIFDFRYFCSFIQFLYLSFMSSPSPEFFSSSYALSVYTMRKKYTNVYS